MDRNVAIPHRALTTTLKSFSRRIEALESRGAWPGAIRVTSVDIQQAAPSTLFGDPLVYTEAVSMALEPGRWVIFGSITHAITRSEDPDTGSTPFRFHVKVASRGVTGEVISEREVWAENDALTGTSKIEFHVAAVESISDRVATATLWVAASGQPAFGAPSIVSISYFMRSATLLGFPG